VTAGADDAAQATGGAADRCEHVRAQQQEVLQAFRQFCRALLAGNPRVQVRRARQQKKEGGRERSEMKCYKNIDKMYLVPL
jgi:hypothetical protein